MLSTFDCFFSRCRRSSPCTRSRSRPRPPPTHHPLHFLILFKLICGESFLYIIRFRHINGWFSFFHTFFTKLYIYVFLLACVYIICSQHPRMCIMYIYKIYFWLFSSFFVFFVFSKEVLQNISSSSSLLFLSELSSKLYWRFSAATASAGCLLEKRNEMKPNFFRTNNFFTKDEA